MGDVQVASTTDSQEAVNAAAGAAHEEAEQAPETPAEEHPQVDNEIVDEPAPKSAGKDPFEKRIGKLTAQKSALTARATAAEERATKVEAELAEARKSKPKEAIESEPVR